MSFVVDWLIDWMVTYIANISFIFRAGTNYSILQYQNNYIVHINDRDSHWGDI